jgi:hypothetical protein
VRELKALAEMNQRSMEQEIRDIIEEHAGDRLSAIRQIELSWQKQRKRPKAKDVDRWIRMGRE